MARLARLAVFTCAALACNPGVPAQGRARLEQVKAQAPLPTENPARKPADPPVEAARQAKPGTITSAITLADIGFGNGFRFANLGGRREFFVPLPQGAEIAATELNLVVDDVSAHDARRSIEVMVNDRSVAAIPLDGKGAGRAIRIPLGNVRARDGFLKISFLYSGAATQDRCIDVRYVGDSLTIRPESAVGIEIDFAAGADVATTAALMPREVAVVLPKRRLDPADLAAALTISRALSASGRNVTFHQGYDVLPRLTERADPRFWSRGLILIGTLQEVFGPDAPVGTVVDGGAPFGALVTARIDGLPALVVADAGAVRAGRLFASPTLAATRGVKYASVGEIAKPRLPTDQVNFDRLGIVLPQADVFGRADLPVTIDTRMLPANTRPARLVLDVMVAPDGAGEKAVVSAFVNERLVESAVALTGEPTRLDIPLTDGLIGTTASVRAVVQRRSAQGDCRFEPQGYPAQILGSSAVVLENAAASARDFSDLVPHWTNGVEVLLPAASADRPLMVLDVVARVLNVLTADTAPYDVKLLASGASPSPGAPFIAVSDVAPAGAAPRVRFDRGRVAVADRSGKTLLDLGGFSSGAVAQVVQANGQPGLWIKPPAGDGSLPAPQEVRLDRGDVAFIDKSGVALAMSTERDTLIRVNYLDQVSWMSVADRFRTWIFGGMWVCATIAFLLALQRMLRRRPRASE